MAIAVNESRVFDSARGARGKKGEKDTEINSAWQDSGSRSATATVLHDEPAPQQPNHHHPILQEKVALPPSWADLQLGPAGRRRTKHLCARYPVGTR